VTALLCSPVRFDPTLQRTQVLRGTSKAGPLFLRERPATAVDEPIKRESPEEIDRNSSSAVEIGFGARPATPTPRADQALARMRTEHAVVPSLWWFEVRNILVVNERRSESESPVETVFSANSTGFGSEWIVSRRKPPF
jgi:hypothetical protein